MNQFEGVFTALITPFIDGEVDYKSLEKLVKRQLKQGIHGLVPLGSTGEAATLTTAEKAKIIDVVVGTVAGQIPVVAGAGTNCTATTIEGVKLAKEHGADAVLVVSPYYNKPTDDGVIAHFKAAIEASDLPVVAYNVPGRTGHNIHPALANRLADLPQVMALKEASGNLSQVSEIASLTRDKWNILSGEDGLLVPTCSVGGKGLISVSSNVDPQRYANIYNLWKSGDVEKARDEQLTMLKLVKAMFMITNPIPVKAACALLGLCENEVRLPLLPLAGEKLEELKGVLTAMEIS